MSWTPSRRNRKRGAKTPQSDIERVKKRLKVAEDHYQEWCISRQKKSGEE